MYIKPVLHCAKINKFVEQGAIFSKMALGGGRPKIGWKGGLRCKLGHVFCSQAREITFTLLFARKQTHKGVQLFKRISKRVVDVKSASGELDKESFCSSGIMVCLHSFDLIYAWTT